MAGSEPTSIGRPGAIVGVSGTPRDDTIFGDTIAPTRPEIPSVDVGVPLGAGAFGTVYRGHHRTLDVDVAVKIVSGNAGALDLALNEARFMARLDHPNLVRIHDAGRIGASIYLVIELMDGGSLANLHSMPGPRLLEIAAQLLAGVQALHEAHVIHRDIKPANCLVRLRDRRVKLADFGIASERAMAQLEMAGTLAFMAPELFDVPPQIGERSDLYAVGMTLACLALPDDPFPRGSVTDLIEWARSGSKLSIATARPDLPPRLTNLVERLLAPDPADRPGTATEALAALLAEGSFVPVTPELAESADHKHRVGPWVIGAEIYRGHNWRAFAATHATTGLPARFARVNPGTEVVQVADVILEASARFSRFDHPGLLPILDWGVAEELPYMVSAPVNRQLLELAKDRPLGELDAVGLVADLADSVAFLHERSLVYQIVEPGAAYITPDGRHAQLGWHVYSVPTGTPLVTDDGLPRRAGIPQFMAPEAFGTTHAIEPAVDLWGLGEILYYLCAGSAAYGETDYGERGAKVAPTSMESLARLVASKRSPPQPLRDRAPNVTQPTARIAMELLEPDSNKRPTSAAAVRDELRFIASRLQGRR